MLAAVASSTPGALTESFDGTVNYLPASCPAGASPPRGILFNHVSKLGGTSMKRILEAVARELRVPYLYARSSSWNEFAASTKRAVVFEHDIEPITVSDRDRRNFFVLGTIRPACSYALSNWAYKSNLLHVYNGPQNKSQNIFEKRASAKWMREGWQDYRGLHHPYTGVEDLQRLERAVINNHQTELSVELKIRRRLLPSGSNGSAPFMDAAHCWMHTSTLVPDLIGCLRQYAACGGEELNATSERVLRDAFAHASNPSNHNPCTAYFRPELAERVSGLSPSVTRAFGGLCCD